MAGYVSPHKEYYGSQAKISAWGVPYMNSNSSYEVSVTLLNFNGDRISVARAGLHVRKIILN